MTELNPTSYRQFSNLKKRNIFQVGKGNNVQSTEAGNSMVSGGTQDRSDTTGAQGTQ